LLKTNGHASHDSDSEGQADAAQPNGYGTASDASTDSTTDSNQSSDTDDDENPYERRQRQASEQMEKRLKEKGNWLTYAKSFMVGNLPPGLNHITNKQLLRSSSPTSGP
jgi:hypothetical protein